MEIGTVFIIALFFGTIILFLFGLKKVLDAEAYQSLTNKIVAYIVKAEIDIQGEKRGIERLHEVVHNVVTTASKSEKKLLKKLHLHHVVITIFDNIVVPILFRKGM